MPAVDAIFRQHNAQMVGLSASVWAKRLHRGIVPELPIQERHLDEVACCVGDAAHNLRAALDLMAVEAVERSGGKTDRVQFPFGETHEQLTGVGGKRGVIEQHRFNWARKDAVELLINLRPHGGADGNRLLWGLHKLDIVDKHQDIIALAHDRSRPAIYFKGARVPSATAAPLRLVFASGVFKNEEILKALNMVADEVERALDMFCAVFDYKISD